MLTIEHEPQAYDIDRLIREDLAPERKGGWTDKALLSLSAEEKEELENRVEHINTGLAINKIFMHCEIGKNPVLDACYYKLESVLSAYYLEDFFAPDVYGTSFQRCGLAAHLFLDPSDGKSFYIFLGKRAEKTNKENTANVVSRPDIVFIYSSETNYLFTIVARFSRMFQLLEGPGQKIVLPLYNIFKNFGFRFGPQVISRMLYEQSLGSMLAREGYERIEKLPDEEDGAENMHVLTYPGLPPYFTTFVARNGEWCDSDGHYFGLPGYAFYDLSKSVTHDMISLCNTNAFIHQTTPKGISILSEQFATKKLMKDLSPFANDSWLI